MNNKTRNAFATSSLEILKYAVLDVLYKWRSISKTSLLRGEIAQLLELPTPSPHIGYHAGFIGGILWHLYEAGYVEDTGGNRWRITERKGFSTWKVKKKMLNAIV